MRCFKRVDVVVIIPSMVVRIAILMIFDAIIFGGVGIWAASRLACQSGDSI